MSFPHQFWLYGKIQLAEVTETVPFQKQYAKSTCIRFHLVVCVFPFSLYVGQWPFCPIKIIIKNTLKCNSLELYDTQCQRNVNILAHKYRMQRILENKGPDCHMAQMYYYSCENESVWSMIFVMISMRDGEKGVRGNKVA